MSLRNWRTPGALRAALLLGGCALLAVSLLAAVHRLASPRIEAAERARERALLATVLPPGLHDNDLLHDVVQVHAPGWLGTDTVAVRRARREGKPAALVLTSVAEGYAGPIVMLVAVGAGGELLGVRVLRHQETPGLGDWIERERSDWIDRFRGRSLADPPLAQWRVRRDGGAFDQFAGATVTPRAVVAALARTLRYVQAHASQLYAARSGSRLVHDAGGAADPAADAAAGPTSTPTPDPTPDPHPPTAR